MGSIKQFMVINSEEGTKEEILGKYMYYSLPKLIIKAERVNKICEDIGFPVMVNENISVTDAFRSATGDIRDRIDDVVNGETVTRIIYCRDNKRTSKDVLSRELVEETLNESTNSYKKLANITLDKDSNTMLLSDVDYTSARDISHYFKEAQRLFELYQSCIGNRSIETMAEKYIAGMHATGISARGHHYFVPKAYMHKISLLEDFMELIGPENLFEYSNKRDSKYIIINSMYVADDEKQRNKMAREFYQDMGREIDEYQRRITHLIQSGNSSQRILDRWLLKIESLEKKKKEYEEILKQDLSGIESEFTMLKSMCEQFRMGVLKTKIFGITEKAA